MEDKAIDEITNNIVVEYLDRQGFTFVIKELFQSPRGGDVCVRVMVSSIHGKSILRTHSIAWVEKWLYNAKKV